MPIRYKFPTWVYPNHPRHLGQADMGPPPPGSEFGPPPPPGSMTTPAGTTVVPSVVEVPWYTVHQTALIAAGIGAGLLFLLTRRRR